MMFTDPSGMEADLIGIDRLVKDVGNELVGIPMVVLVVVVAEREIAEMHSGHYTERRVGLGRTTMWNLSSRPDRTPPCRTQRLP